MDLLPRYLSGGVFTAVDAQGRMYRKKRDKAIAPSVLVSDRPSFGLVGSDLMDETDYALMSESVCVVSNLRFALATSLDKSERTLSKIRYNEPITIGTSYPNTAMREMGKIGMIGQMNSRSVQPGGIEALPQEYPEIDAIFDLVRSGDTVRDNNLVIIEDDIRSVNLMLVRRDTV